ncbi:MAG: CHASE domain-containing protein, partial [Planctomycetota bacterium]|nr:CHASE domain-containing protein [Planctomycetota bacterium]
AVHSVNSLYASSVHVERNEFTTFNQHLLSRHTGVQAMEWLPRVSREQRAEYEARARADGFTDFVFTERDAEGQFVAAGDREEYYPVFFVEPRAPNEAAIGFDVASNPDCREALCLARDSGHQVATGPLTLVQKTVDQTGLLVFDPIYAKDMPLSTVADRRRALQGFVLGVFRVDDIVQASLHQGSPREFHVTIVDAAAPPDKQVICSAMENGSFQKAADVASHGGGDIGWSATLPIAGRSWQIDFMPAAGFFASHSNRHLTLILSGGLAFTGLLGTFLLILAGRTARVEELVADRTSELSTTNEELAQEIAHRKRFEHALSQAHQGLERRVIERTAELTASEARYLDLYDNAPDMFVSVDVATQRVTECNKTFLTVTGFSKSEIVDRHVYDLYHPDCLDEARRSFRLFLTTGKTQDLELLLLRADGNVVDVSMNVSAVRGADGKLLYSRAVLRDITAKKQAEARIKNQEIELAHVSRLSMMGEMATGLAHEINQPLAAIAAYAEGAAMRLRNGNVDTHRLAEVVDRISADAHRAGEVIRRLRHFVRKREPDRTQVDLNELVTDVVQFVATDARQREVTIGFDLDDDLPALQADAVEIQQVLLNLVRNGCDAMQETDPANRHLVIRTRSDGQESIEVDVEDRGHGLSENMEDQVFEAFFSSKNDGLGMGLAISRSIIESHGGRIWVTPNLEGGATFHFSLPAAKGVLIDE